MKTCGMRKMLLRTTVVFYSNVHTGRDTSKCAITPNSYSAQTVVYICKIPANNLSTLSRSKSTFIIKCDELILMFCMILLLNFQISCIFRLLSPMKIFVFNIVRSIFLYFHFKQGLSNMKKLKLVFLS